jgi:membrane protein
MLDVKTSARGPDGRTTYLAWTRPATYWDLLYATAMQWSADNVPRLGAALAFYSVLSIAPLLLISLAGAALIFGQEAASGHIVDQIRGVVGTEGAEAIQDMLNNARKPRAGTVAALIGFATLLFAASGVFGELQGGMNTIWKVQPKPDRGIVGFLKDRFFSFAMVLGTGFLLLTSLILSTAIAAMSGYIVGVVPVLKPALLVGDTIASAMVITLLFALIFKILPDAKIAWRDVWVGAALTMIVFLVGKAMLGAYLGRSSYGSAYGAAGSLVVLVVWVYYSSQIVYFGAEFTQVYANRYGARVEPTENAEPVSAVRSGRE